MAEARQPSPAGSEGSGANVQPALGCATGVTKGIEQAVKDLNKDLADGAKIKFISRGGEPCDGPGKQCKKIMGIKVKENFEMDPNLLWGQAKCPLEMELTAENWKSMSDSVAAAGRASGEPSGVPPGLQPGGTLGAAHSSPGPTTPRTPASDGGSRARTATAADLAPPIAKRAYRKADINWTGVEVAYPSAHFPPMVHHEYEDASEFIICVAKPKVANLTLWFGPTPRDLILEYRFNEADCAGTNLSPGVALYEVRSPKGVWHLAEPHMELLTSDESGMHEMGIKVVIGRGILAAASAAASVPGTPR